MAYWLFKTEPDEYSIDDLQAEPEGFAVWDGIRNYQARNNLRDRVAAGDDVLIYHSSCKRVGVVGTARVVRAAYPDPDQFNPDSKYFDPKAQTDNPRWYCVDVMFTGKFTQPVSMSTIRQDPRLADMALVTQGRLSIQPVTAREWQIINQQGN